MAKTTLLARVGYLPRYTGNLPISEAGRFDSKAVNESCRDHEGKHDSLDSGPGNGLFDRGFDEVFPYQL
jgi:hypothetical protein